MAKRRGAAVPFEDGHAIHDKGLKRSLNMGYPGCLAQALIC